MKFRKLYAEEIECRVAQVTDKGASLVLYKDARVDQRILDEEVGAFNWQRHHSRDNANCIVAIKNPETGEWIEKEDTGTESYMDAEKGLASDSFKRACFNWGIGRELYTAPFIWVKAGEGVEVIEADTDAKGKKRYTTFDRFKVVAIGYDAEGNISYLVIRNTKSKKVVYSYGSATQQTTPKEESKAEPKQEAPKQLPEDEAEGQQIINQVAAQRIDSTKVVALSKAAQEHGVPIEKILKLYKVTTVANLTENQFANINQHWEDLKKA